jgi:hypothetical protein
VRVRVTRSRFRKRWTGGERHDEVEEQDEEEEDEEEDDGTAAG